MLRVLLAASRAVVLGTLLLASTALAAEGFSHRLRLRLCGKPVDGSTKTARFWWRKAYWTPPAAIGVVGVASKVFRSQMLGCLGAVRADAL